MIIDKLGNILQLVFSLMSSRYPFDTPWGVIKANNGDPLCDHWIMHRNWREVSMLEVMSAH